MIPCALAANAFPLALAVCATASNVALSTEALDDTSLFLISTILFTGCLVILVEISFLDISMSFWYLILYVVSLIPSIPFLFTTSFLSPSPVDKSLVSVSKGIVVFSTTIFSTILL